MVLLTWTIKLFWFSCEGNLFHCKFAIPHKLAKNFNVTLKVCIILMVCFSIFHAFRIWEVCWEIIINVILC